MDGARMPRALRSTTVAARTEHTGIWAAPPWRAMAMRRRCRQKLINWCVREIHMTIKQEGTDKLARECLNYPAGEIQVTCERGLCEAGPLALSSWVGLVHGSLNWGSVYSPVDLRTTWWLVNQRRVDWIVCVQLSPERPVQLVRAPLCCPVGQHPWLNRFFIV